MSVPRPSVNTSGMVVTLADGPITVRVLLTNQDGSGERTARLGLFRTGDVDPLHPTCIRQCMINADGSVRTTFAARDIAAHALPGVQKYEVRVQYPPTNEQWITLLTLEWTDWARRLNASATALKAERVDQ